MDQSQLSQYLPVLMLGFLAVGFSAGMIGLSVYLGRWANRNRLSQAPVPAVKNIAYECGMLPVGEGNTRLSVKFYLVEVLFILFDIEVVFLYHWDVIYKS